MKRIEKYIEIIIGLAFATLMAVSCQKSEIIDTNKAQPGALHFSPTLGAAQTATRAAESDNNVLRVASAEGATHHIVIKTYTGVAGSSLQEYFSDELCYFKSGGYWDVNSGKKRFLPPSGMNLYGYFATDILGNGNISNVEYTPPTPTDYPKLTFTPDQRGALHQVDLLAAKVENITNPDVLIPFHHILSQINFGVKGIDRHKILISNIRINNVQGNGNFDYNSWSWSFRNPADQSYSYYFPDRTESDPDSGSGLEYMTSGAIDDSKNTYLFGDGGKFGPGRDDTFLYAQTQAGYATKENTPAPLHNSLMLVPQQITRNTNATVTFDYTITIDGRVIRSGTNQIVSLNAYYDWKPNLRYLYLFDLTDPSEKIVFDVSIDEWQNWDSNGTDTGIKNGTIQQPTAKTLNTIGDNETIYLLGLLERNLLWDWSDSTHTFDNINKLTLDFSGVETMTYSVEVKVPTSFKITGINPSTGGKLTITRNAKKLLKPTERELNLLKNSDSLTLYGTLSNDSVWNWRDVKFSSLRQNESFVLDFSEVKFNSGKEITLQLPVGVIASGGAVSSDNPYTIRSAGYVAITNNRVSAVVRPSRSILDVVSDNTVVGVNGGTVGSAGDNWDWSRYTFDNLDPQESFYLDFSGVVFNSQKIKISLPVGFRGFGDSNLALLNPYLVADNGKVRIKNNKINYPTPEYINALSGEHTVALAGEKLPGDNAPLDWSSYAFPNFSPQTSFMFDIMGVDFVEDLVLKVPPYFTLSGGERISGSNSYTFRTPTTVTIKNDRVPKPSDQKINLVKNGEKIIVDGGKLLSGEIWNWNGLPFASLGGRGNSFSVTFRNIDFNGNYIEINMPGFIISDTGMSGSSFGIYRITTNTTITIKDERRVVTGVNPTLIDVKAGQRIVLTGAPSGAQGWTWEQMPDLDDGDWFEIDYSQVETSGTNYLYLPSNGATYFVSGDCQFGWAYLFYKQHSGYIDGIVRFTRFKQYSFPDINNDPPAVTGSTYVLPAGTMYGPYSWGWWKWLAPGSSYSISFNNIIFKGSITVILPDGYTATATGSGFVINGTTLTISDKCVVIVKN